MHVKDNNKTSFNNLMYMDYRKSQGKKPVFDDWSIAYNWYLRNWLPTNKEERILDIGCGEGHLLAALAKWGYTNVQGLELRTEAVSICSQRGLNVKLGNAIEYLKSHTNEFQMIFAIDVIEHLTKEECFDLLQSAHHALMPNGSIVIQTPNLASPFAGVTFFGDITHQTGFTPTSLAQIMRAARFSTIEVRPTGPGLWSFRSACYYLIWNLIVFLLRMINHIECRNFRQSVLTRNMIARGSFDTHPTCEKKVSVWKKKKVH
ncbi:MAG: class I SAM-dependent methyltransferase [Candidatus Scalindua sediminis]|nr:class I SAM-dependent methyltransferase [Candidatus Scalindua sediminis]